LSGTGFYADCGLQAMQYTLHDIHAHTAPGHGGDLFGGAETRFLNKVQSFGVGQSRHFFRTNESEFHGFFAHARNVDAAPIVADFDENLIALVI